MSVVVRKIIFYEIDRLICHIIRSLSHIRQKVNFPLSTPWRLTEE